MFRRILKRMLTPLPGEEGFDKYRQLPFSLEEVRRIGDEYGCSVKNLQHLQKRVLSSIALARVAITRISVTTGAGGL